MDFVYVTCYPERENKLCGDILLSLTVYELNYFFFLEVNGIINHPFGCAVEVLETLLLVLLDVATLGHQLQKS